MNNLDSRIFEFLYSLSNQSGPLDVLFVFLAKSLPWIITLWAIWLIFMKKDWGNNVSRWKNRFQYLALGFISVVISRGIVANTLHAVMNSPRPFAALNLEPLVDHAAFGSFPSGHMSFLVPIVLLLFLVSKRAGWWALVLTLLVGISRIIVGVHWPLDILGGIGVGIFSFLLVRLLFQKKKLI